MKRWHRQWQASRTRDLPIVDVLSSRLERAAPDQHELTLVHGDFHLLNLIFDLKEPKVRAVLDWELCTLGDPLGDLGGLLAYWAQPGEYFGPAAFAVSAFPGFPTRRELARAYGRRSGRDLTALPFWEALACWKIAIIADGVQRRRLDEPANVADDEVLLDNRTVDLMLKRATGILDAADL